MKHILDFLRPCLRESSDYAGMVSTMSMVVGILRLIAG
jgi:hypothetical protein